MALLLSAVLPLQVVVAPRFSVRTSSVFRFGPVMDTLFVKVVLAAPDIVPPVQLTGPWKTLSVPASVLPLRMNGVVCVPPLIATVASAPTFSVLISKVPAPLVVTLFSVWLPLRNSSLAPFAMLNTPVLVLGSRLDINIVPAFTFTVPVLLNAVPMTVVVFDCLLKVPLLLKTPPPLPRFIALSKVLASVKVPLLLNTLAPEMPMALLPLPVLPDQVVLPAFTMRPPDSVLLFGPLMLSVLAKVVLCAAVPVIVPPVQVAGPPNV